MKSLNQAIIPQKGENLKASHLFSFAEAFNSRILSGAGDSHWRIPYYIFSAYFRKPRLDDNMLYTPESEFFDFYQFVNPSNGETWPTNPPQEPEGANLQSNYLNRFIFGMNYQAKDNKDGAWLYEREDVRIFKGQEKIINDATSFRGTVFPFFSAVGTDTGNDREYTSFAISSEIYSNGYVSGKPENPQGNSFGGYYGTNPLIIKKDGCGKDSQTGREYPISQSTILELDGDKANKNTSINFDVCNEGKGDLEAPSSYGVVINNKNSFSTFEINNNIAFNPKSYPKNRFHLSQYPSTVFFGREGKNHIHRLLYNYITYAKGFDFDWFFNTQYAYAPEIGSFANMTFIYDQNPDKYYGRLNLLDTKIQIEAARLTLEKTDLTSGGDFSLLITAGFTAKTIADNAQINIKYYNEQEKLTDKTTITGTSNILNYLRDNDYLSEGAENIKEYLYTYDSNNPEKVVVPLGFTLHAVTISSEHLAKFTLRTEVYLNNKDIAYKDTEIDLTPLTPNQEVSIPISTDVFLATLVSEFEFSVKFKVKNVILRSGASSASIVLRPIFLFSYKPNIEDAYALLRVATYNGIKDADFDDINHPLNKAYSISNRLKESGVLGEGDVSLAKDIHTPNSIELNTNGVYEASRRLSLYARIIKPDYFVGIVDKRTLKFQRFAGQSSVVSLRMSNKTVFSDIEEVKTIPYNVFNRKNKDEMDASPTPIGSLAYPAIFTAFTGVTFFYYTECKRYEFRFQNQQNGIIAKLNNDLVASLATTVKETTYESVVNKNNTVFEPISYIINYDSVVSSIDDNGADSGKYIFYYFQNIKGEPFNAGKEDAPIYYAKRYNSNNVANTIADGSLIIGKTYGVYEGSITHDGQEYKSGSIFNAVNANYTEVDGTPLIVQIRYLDDSGNITLDADDLNFVGKNISVYTFVRTPNESGLATAQINSGLGFYFIGKDGSFVKKDLTADLNKYNYSGTIGVRMPVNSVETALPDAPLFEELTSPNKAPIISSNSIKGSNIINLSSTIVAGQNIVNVDSTAGLVVGQELLKRLEEPYDNDPGNFGANPAIASIVNSTQFTVNVLHANSGIINFQAAEILQTSAIYYLNLGVSGELKNLASVLYGVYANNKIIYNESTSGVIYTNGEANIPNLGSFDVENYNKYLAGYKIVVSYFKNHDFVNNIAFDNSTAFTGASPSTPTEVKFSIVDNSNNLVGTVKSYGLDESIELPKLEAGQKIKIEVTTNNFRSKNGEIVNFNVYLAIVNVILSSSDPLLEAIIREGSLLISRKIKLILDTNPLPQARDMFQDIAPKLNTLSGSLLINQTYKVTEGTISHNGTNYGVGYADTFKAQSSTYDIISQATPRIIQENGIIEIAPPFGFTNEWAFWINFLPYSPFETSTFKESVYGATNSPFIDRCHINSFPIRNSVENNYFNLGLPKAYIPETPPSYRYVPLLTKKGIAYANVVGESNYKRNFYKGCPAFRPPYKIKKAYVTSADGYNNVYIELTEDIQGYNTSLAESANANETFRTDFNGLNDWKANGKLRFRSGDASITNDFGSNQSVSHTSNGYLGSYYPRFFFVKLIPKPYLDENNIANDGDSPCKHEMIKQGELYLEAMREGFTEPGTRSMGKLSCENIKGHLTSPDYKYDQLLVNSTSTASYYGNKWPSLLTFSKNFNTSENGGGPLRYFDNPKGYGPIPFVGTYLESYQAICKSVNRLTTFRVPYPVDVTAETKVSQITEAFEPSDPQKFIRPNPGGLGPIWAKDQNPASLAGLANNPNITTTTVVNLRNNEGILGGTSASQVYSIIDETPGESSWNLNLKYAFVGKSYSTTKININTIDRDLRDIAYSHISSNLIFFTPTLAATVYKQKTISSLVSINSNPINTPKGDPCSNTYTNANGQGFYNIITDIESEISCSEVNGNVSLTPDSLKVGDPFYRRITQRDCGGDGGLFNQLSFSSSSSITYGLHDTGFQLLTLPVNVFNINDPKIT